MFDEKEEGRCSRCHRCTWSKYELGKQCNMIQPNGTKCKGKFKKINVRGDRTSLD